jgi:hypothetical protein
MADFGIDAVKPLGSTARISVHAGMCLYFKRQMKGTACSQNCKDKTHIK